MPVSKLTANCIRNSFQSSGKRHLFLTGSKGSGKTTLLRELSDETFPGVSTHVIREEGVFLRENGKKEEIQIGIFSPESGVTENRMHPLEEGFLKATEILERCLKSASDWVTVDEIGYLEEKMPSYQKALEKLMEKKHLLAAVRKQDLPFLQKLLSRDDAFVVDLDEPFGKIGCVIMASGFGRRFGGNKLLAPFHGAPLMETVLNATNGIFSRRIVVTRYEEVETLCREKGIEVLRHDLPYKSDTVRLGVEAMEGMDGCLFCPADQPLLRSDTVKALALCAVSDPDHIWRASSGEKTGSPVFFPKRYFSALKALPKGHGGTVLIERFPEEVRLLSVTDPFELSDVDTPEDLTALEKR